MLLCFFSYSEVIMKNSTSFDYLVQLVNKNIEVHFFENGQKEWDDFEDNKESLPTKDDDYHI